jgi:pectate lyase
MKKLLYSLCILHFTFYILHSLPAFPGAEGWGANTPGGRGGQVLIVTNTNAYGPGSFFDALSTPGPRIIVFRTSGVITFDRIHDPAFELNGPYSNVTIAGQTSPGSITLKGTFNNNGGSILYCYQKCRADNFHDGIFRFLRFRANCGNMDGITMTYSHNFILDHCDISGASDESLDLTHDSTFTVQWCTIANPCVGYGNYGYGSLMAYDPSSKITMHHNLWAHLVHRAPYLHWSDIPGYATPYDGLIEYSNQISYNIEKCGFILGNHIGDYQPGGIRINMRGNTFRAGPNTDYGVWRDISLSEAKVYDVDNYCYFEDGTEGPCPFLGGTDPEGDPDDRYGEKMASRWDEIPPVTYTASAQAYEEVLNWVGAFPRDSMTRRTVYEVQTQTGDFLTNSTQRNALNQGTPLITTGPPAPADSDNDGMPDFWEAAMGFNQNSASDNSQDHDGDGYLNIEEYINDLALARVCRDYYNPVYPIPSNWDDYNPSCCAQVSDVDTYHPAVSVANSISIRSNPYAGQGPLGIVLPSISGVIQVLDIQGRIIIEEKADNAMNLNGAMLVPGLYLVRWQENNNIRAAKRLVVIN